MSHLKAALDLKNELTELGIKVATDQELFINEGYVRALTSRYSKLGLRINEFNELAWTVLEKWNGYAPVPARFIVSSFCQRINKINDTLIQFGTIPPGTISTGITVGDRVIEFSELKTLDELVKALIKEF